MEKKRCRKRKGQRKDGTFAVYGDYGRDAEGKRIRKTFYGETLEEANYKKAQYERDIADGMSVDAHKMNVSEWCDSWMRVYKSKLKGTNRVSYEANVARLKEDIGQMMVKDVRNYHLQKSLNNMEGMSESAISKYKMVIQQIFRRAKQNKIIRDNPAEDLDIPGGTSGGHRALERWEADFIIEHYHQHRAGLWMMLMLLAGLRRSEMIALQWDCVDLENRTLQVRRAAEIVSNQAVIKEWTKSDAGLRMLPICDALYVALSAIPENCRKGHVCLSANNKLISQSAFDRGMDGFNLAMERLLNGEPLTQRGRRTDVERKRTTKANNITTNTTTDATTEESIAITEEKLPKRKTFSIEAHDLRYTFATALYDAGIDVKSAQYYMGHSDIRMTMNIYTQLSKERENQARAATIEFLDSWLQKEAPKMQK